MTAPCRRRHHQASWHHWTHAIGADSYDRLVTALQLQRDERSASTDTKFFDPAATGRPHRRDDEGWWRAGFGAGPRALGKNPVSVAADQKRCSRDLRIRSSARTSRRTTTCFARWMTPARGADLNTTLQLLWGRARLNDHTPGAQPTFNCRPTSGAVIPVLAAMLGVHVRTLHLAFGTQLDSISQGSRKEVLTSGPWLAAMVSSHGN